MTEEQDDGGSAEVTQIVYERVIADVIEKCIPKFEGEGQTIRIEEFKQRWIQTMYSILEARTQGQENCCTSETKSGTSSPNAPSVEAKTDEKQPKTEQSEQEEEDTLAGIEDDDDTEVAADVDAPNIALCLYERVKRVKAKWKIVLRDGILLPVGHRDVLFHQISGDFNF